ncbi:MULTISPECIES: DAK2 domain-containing protein [unclassified Pseudonocardia]|uniref:DAK2 domain-containing protein n=1 Tax=unclassified Pseudonocardia TaxID=2619320 RepID=UPI0001FFF341|nr:DAK2 domain-containing protein [Pseudonocardia sp. Ae707_Ps1]OLM19028.1 Phosphoenolpyruvate-dihydroxyacetone phosphotransferase, ADP-binding subunit DhaL [Pseudonocardia sp. Ae707_Ps1]
MIDQDAVLDRFARAVEDGHGALTDLDQHSGDGDFGDNLRAGVRHAVRLAERGPRRGFSALGEVFLDEVGGTSGPLLGLLFTEIARSLTSSHAPGTHDVAALAAGARAGLTAIQRVGEAEVGDRTLVDALAPAVTALGRDGVAAAATAAREGAEGTADLTARHGRASYVGERAKGEPDPGAVGVAVLFWAIARVAEPEATLTPPLPGLG